MDIADILQIIIKQIDKLGNSCSAEDKAKIKDILLKVFQTGESPAKAMKYPKDQIELMYSYSVSLYEGGKFTEARNGFHQLTQLEPDDIRFLFGYAASLHKLKEYQKAIDIYLLVARKQQDNPAPYAHAADCYIKLGNRDVACVMLLRAIEVAGDNPQHAKLKKEAEIIKESLQKQTGTMANSKVNV